MYIAVKNMKIARSFRFQCEFLAESSESRQSEPSVIKYANTDFLPNSVGIDLDTSAKK